MSEIAATLQARSPQSRLRIAIAIATSGRPDVVHEAIGLLRMQTREPDGVLVCAPSPGDIDRLREDYPSMQCFIGPRGLTYQRNRLLEAAADFDVLAFLDDDFIMFPEYLAETEAVFADRPEVVLTTGSVVADGIVGPGLTFHDAREVVKNAKESSNSIKAVSGVSRVYNGYGCNMAVRLATVRAHALRFDEELPLYAWLEDVDFSRSIAPFGQIVRLEAARGVHLGIKSGRQSGIRLGYSQIANPCYLIAKGTCSWGRGLFNMSKNFAANVWGALRRERTVDRAGRLRGNLKGISDLITLRLTPSRALHL